MKHDLENGFYLTDDNPFILSRCEEVQRLMAQSYWANQRPAEVQRAAMEHSLCYAIVDLQADALIGFARVVTDFATMYYLCDVLIDERYRGRGLGKRLVEWIASRDERLRGTYGLLKTRDAQGLYAQYGFRECPSGCMAKY